MNTEIREVGFLLTFALLFGFGYFNVSFDSLAFTQPAPPYRYLIQEANAEVLNPDSIIYPWLTITEPLGPPNPIDPFAFIDNIKIPSIADFIADIPIQKTNSLLAQAGSLFQTNFNIFTQDKLNQIFGIIKQKSAEQNSGFNISPEAFAISVPDAPANVTATADIDTVIVDWDAVVSVPDVDRYWIERGLNFNDVNGTWQYREMNYASFGGTPDCDWDATSTGVRMEMQGSNVRSDGCTLFKILPTDLINNTSVRIDWTGSNTGTGTSISSIVKYGNVASFRNPSTILPVLHSTDVIASGDFGTFPPIALTPFFTKSNTGGWARTINTYAPSLSQFDTKTGNPFTTLAIVIEDVNTINNPITLIHSINITDNFSGDTKAFWNFSSPTQNIENTGSCLSHLTPTTCDFGTIESGDFNLNSIPEVIGNTDGSNLVYQDEFSTYPSNATANLTWVRTITGLGSSDDIAGVNATADNLVLRANIQSSSRILLDLETILGKKLTDVSGNGNFSLKWESQAIEDEANLNGGSQVVGVFKADPSGGFDGINTGASVDFNWKNDAFINTAILRVDNSDSAGAFNSNLSSDASCGTGATVFPDTIPNDGFTDSPVTTYHEFNKTDTGINTTYKYRVGTSSDYSGLGCSLTGVEGSLDNIDNIKYLVVYQPNTGAGTDPDSKSYFDNFQLYTEDTTGNPLTFFIDTTQDRGLNYTYGVFGENTIGNGTSGLSNNVLTNDVPDQVEDELADNSTSGQIDIQWDALAFNSGEGFPSTGLNLTKYNIFRNNVTTGGGFFLLASNLASSPPDSFYNDTDVIGGDEYEYQVSGCNAIDCGDNSTSVSLFAFAGSPPNAPTGLSGSANLTNIDLDWNNQLDADTFNVIRNGSEITTGLLVSSYIDPNVTPGGIFEYSVTAVNGTGFTNGTTILVTANDVPSTVTGAGVMANNGVSLILEWDDPVADRGEGTNSTGLNVFYDIFRRNLTLLTSYINLTTIAEGTDTYEDFAVTGGETYAYKILSKNEIGFAAANSTEVSAMVANALVITSYESDGVTDLDGDVSVRLFNDTFTSTLTGDGQGRVSFPQLSGDYDFTVTHIQTGFIINKTTTPLTVPFNSDVFVDVATDVHRVNCPSNGPAADLLILVNSSSADHYISSFTEPVCNAQNKLTWDVFYTGLGGGGGGGGGGEGEIVVHDFLFGNNGADIFSVSINPDGMIGQNVTMDGESITKIRVKTGNSGFDAETGVLTGIIMKPNVTSAFPELCTVSGGDSRYCEVVAYSDSLDVDDLSKGQNEILQFNFTSVEELTGNDILVGIQWEGLDDELPLIVSNQTNFPFVGNDGMDCWAAEGIAGAPEPFADIISCTSVFGSGYDDFGIKIFGTKTGIDDAVLFDTLYENQFFGDPNMVGGGSTCAVAFSQNSDSGVCDIVGNSFWAEWDSSQALIGQLVPLSNDKVTKVRVANIDCGADNTVNFQAFVMDEPVEGSSIVPTIHQSSDILTNPCSSPLLYPDGLLDITFNFTSPVELTGDYLIAIRPSLTGDEISFPAWSSRTTTFSGTNIEPNLRFTEGELWTFQTDSFPDWRRANIDVAPNTAFFNASFLDGLYFENDAQTNFNVVSGILNNGVLQEGTDSLEDQGEIKYGTPSFWKFLHTLSGSNKMALNLWFKGDFDDELASGSDYMIISTMNLSTDIDGFMLYARDQLLRLNISENGTNINEQFDGTSFAGTDDGNWHMLTATFDYSGSPEAFSCIDAVCSSEPIGTIPTGVGGDPTHTLTIGSPDSESGNINQTSFEVDDVTVWHGYNLTQADIDSMYNGGAGSSAGATGSNISPSFQKLHTTFNTLIEGGAIIDERDNPHSDVLMAVFVEGGDGGGISDISVPVTSTLDGMTIPTALTGTLGFDGFYVGSQTANDFGSSAKITSMSLFLSDVTLLTSGEIQAVVLSNNTGGNNFEDIVVEGVSNTILSLPAGDTQGDIYTFEFDPPVVIADDSGLNMFFGFNFTGDGVNDAYFGLSSFSYNSAHTQDTTGVTHGVGNVWASIGGSKLSMEIMMEIDEPIPPAFTTSGGIAPENLVIYVPFDAENQAFTGVPSIYNFDSNAGSFGHNASAVRFSGGGIIDRQETLGKFGNSSLYTVTGDSTYTLLSSMRGINDLDFLIDDSTEPYGISFWIKGNFSELAGVGNLPILNSLSSELAGMRTYINNQGEVFFATYNDGGVSASIEGNTNLVVDDTWTQVGITVNKTGLVNLYINGTLDDSQPVDFSAGISSPSDIVLAINEQIGSQTGWTITAEFIDFQIDDLCIWKDYLPTLTDMEYLYNSSDGNPCSTAVPLSVGGGNGTSDFTTQMKTVVLSLGDFGNVAQNLFVNGSQTGTTYAIPIISSDTISVNVDSQDVLLQFTNFILQQSPPGPPVNPPQPPPPPPSAGGGGVQSPRLSLAVQKNILEELFGFSLFSKIHQLQIGQAQDGTIDITWNSPSDITIDAIQVGDKYITWIGFPRSPFMIEGNDRISTGKIPYRIQPPNQLCDEVTGETINCVERILYEIPVKIIATIEGNQVEANTVIKVNFSFDITLALLTIFVLFAAGVGAIIYRAAILPSQRKKKDKKLKFKRKEREVIESRFVANKSKLRRRP